MPTHWSTRGLAANHGISRTTVLQIWRAFGLTPWKQESFKLSPDLQPIEKTRDIVGLYLNPTEAAVVFAVDDPLPRMSVRPSPAVATVGMNNRARSARYLSIH